MRTNIYTHFFASPLISAACLFNRSSLIAQTKRGIKPIAAEVAAILIAFLCVGIGTVAQAQPYYAWTAASTTTTSVTTISNNTTVAIGTPPPVIGGVSTGESVATDVAGNVYTTGSFTGTVDFNPSAGVFNLTSAGATDIFIQKLSPSGSFIWAVRMGGADFDEGLGIAVDSRGNVYTTGYFSGNMNPWGWGSQSAGGSDIFTQKLDTNGNILWVTTEGGPSNDVGNSIAVDAACNVYTTGYFGGTVTFSGVIITGTILPPPIMTTLTSTGGSDIFIQNLNENGQHNWAKKMGGTDYDSGNCIAVDGLGNIYTTGYFSRTVNFGAGNVVSSGSTDIFVQKLNSSGTFVWAKKMGGTKDDIGYGITVDASDNVYTTGYFSGTVNFGAGNVVSSGGADIFVQKLNSSGTFVWSKIIAGTGVDIGYSIAIDGSRNVYIAGYFDGYNRDPYNSVITYNIGGNILIQKLNSNGSSAWQKTMGGSNSDFGYGIAAKTDGTVYITGLFYGSNVNMNPSGGTDSKTGNSYGIFTQKLVPTCNIPTVYAVMGGGYDCPGGTGLIVALSGSEAGVSYQLKNNGSNVGSPVLGLGSSFSFGYQTQTGTYTVVATRLPGGCTANMTRSVSVSKAYATLYVNASHAGASGDGGTWQTAFNTLDEALAVAHCASSCVTRINVAAGTYKPTKIPYNGCIAAFTTIDPRDVTFHIRDGLGIYGGYNATTGNRDIPTNTTILSGDIGVAGNNADNSYHVVMALADPTTGSGVTIDGCSITGGNANGLASISIGSHILYQNIGGGIYAIYGTNTITQNKLYVNTAQSGGGFFSHSGTNLLGNNTIFSNSAQYGGGVALSDGTNRLTNNTIYDNTVIYSGGGIEAFCGNNTLIGNTIHSNSAQSGGGFYTASRFVGGTMMSCGSNILTNNVIYNNLANNAINDHGGGGLNLVSGTNTLTNNTLYNNSSDGNGGGIICSTSTTLTNNIFWQNKQGGSDAVAGADIANPYGTPTVTYCLTQKNSIYSTGTGIINNQDPLFVSTNSTTTDLKLQCGSPAMDAGTGIGAPTTDMLGVATMADKDMGAYESTCDIYAAPNPVATCKTIIRNNVSGNQWYHFADANGIVCSINPNGADLGTVTVVANIISPTTPYLRRSVSATSSNYPNSALISNNSGNPLDYTMRIYYLDTELADFNALTSSNSTYASLRIDWQTGGGDPCNYSNYTLAAIGNGTIPPINVTEGEFGRNNLGFYLGFNLNHFTIFTATTNNIVLPVKLLSFSGHADGDTDRLEWATATESNNKGFEVLYSGNGIDFKTLGFVDGAGDSNSEQHYTFMHQLAALEEATAEGGGYYKLKQVDTDRNFEYSNTIFISRPHHLGLRVFPNPTKDVVNIISTDKSQTTALYDITGLLIYRFDTIPDSIDIRTLAAGTYILRIGSNVRRIVKE